MRAIEFDFCEADVIHYDTLKEISGKMPDESVMLDVSELFKVFGDSTRTRIICALSLAELCVCDIASFLNMSNSAISHQLRILKEFKIVKNRREGKSVYYSLADKHIVQILGVAFEHILEEAENDDDK